MPDDDRLQLTRRKILAGTTAIGAAGVGAGLGTSALFSDEESFEDNTITAGALNLRVTVDNIAHSTTIVRDNVTITPKDTADGAAVTVELADVKPGDWLILEWNPEILANPGYVQVTSVDEDYSNDEGDNPEPETNTSAPGDLGGALLSTIWQSYDDVSGGTSPGDLQGLDSTTDRNDSGLSSYEAPTNLDGETPSGAHYTTMDEAHDVYKTGVTLRNSNGVPLVVGSNSNAAWFYQLLHVPKGVGNEIQGDELTWTLRFDAEQSRNNDNPFNSTS
jgi:predicted ribosomally synthesized peptide with SipW-like signal peptide